MVASWLCRGPDLLAHLESNIRPSPAEPDRTLGQDALRTSAVVPPGRTSRHLPLYRSAANCDRAPAMPAPYGIAIPPAPAVAAWLGEPRAMSSTRKWDPDPEQPCDSMQDPQGR